MIMLNHNTHEIFHWTPSGSDLAWKDVIPLKTEASTRKFWRCRTETDSFILMFSPPETELNDRFIHLGNLFKEHGVPVPAIYEYDSNKGYFLLEDVGEDDFYTQYALGNVDQCLTLAFHTLCKIQAISDPIIPQYEKTRFIHELNIFQDYLCGRLINVNTEAVHSCFDYLVTKISAIPTCTVHRDFHCKNLLVRQDPPFLGVVDYQDALVGPITYDLASLLYDCYWDHDHATIEKQIRSFWSCVLTSQHQNTSTQRTFAIDVKLTALQRLLKAAGIFVRLWLQREQPTHLEYVLPTLRKAQSICEEFEAVRPLGLWLQRNVIPVTLHKIRRQN
ncbi:MAG: phosphotransferase [Gammaproteobacteria bacterium]|nr:phosphotransferase [Gammaproteobacteria bacterium]